MSINDLLKHANDGNATDFRSSFNEIMAEKMQSAIAARASHVASNAIGGDTQGASENEDV